MTDHTTHNAFGVREKFARHCVGAMEEVGWRMLCRLIFDIPPDPRPKNWRKIYRETMDAWEVDPDD